MDALVMCGGRGTRLAADVEKPLLEIAGRPMIDRVLAALADSSVDRVLAVTSPATPETAAHVDVPVVEGAGEGYVADLSAGLEAVDTPALTVGADLPLLDGDAIDWVLSAYETGSAMVAVPAARKEALGVSIQNTRQFEGERIAPSGVNVVGPPEPEHTLMTDNDRFAVNVNRPRDARIATHLVENGPA